MLKRLAELVFVRLIVKLQSLQEQFLRENPAVQMLIMDVMMTGRYQTLLFKELLILGHGDI